MSTADPNPGGPERELFIKALEQPTPAAQSAFLDEACGTDTALRRRLELLLRRFDDIGTFMAEPAAGRHQSAEPLPRASNSPEPTGTTPLTEQLGATIGRYKLLEKLGEGGFGVVYMAQQREPVKRRVALKIIKMGMDTKEVLARFEAERQALALMDHPNIAKILDGGVVGSDDAGGAESQISDLKSQIQWGRPYFVMELVCGIRITDFCDQRQLRLQERLELFVQVCQAVQHAHQKGIIHRDLKPSNILVTLTDPDGPGVPKIIDFGIAKATQQELTEKTLFTAYGQFLGTPAYMSPEQAALTTLDLDTRSDIYSLGVLLYQLLTGRPPFETKELLDAGLEQMLRTIREKEPPRPSARLTTLTGPELSTVAQRQGIEGTRLVHHVRGDLDWIVMKCLEKDRARRYETASDLAADIRRHLGNEPVLARPPSAMDRFAKLVRRNTGAVIASGAILVALIAGVIGTTIGLVGEARQRVLAQNQAQEAKRQAAIAEAIRQFQSDMLASADPHRLLSDKVTVLQVLTGAVKELDAGKLKEEPLVEAGVRETVGLTLRSLGRYDLAEPNLRKSLDLRRRALPAEHSRIGQSLNALALLLQDRGRPAESESLYREALEICRRSLPASHPDIAQCLNNLALALQTQGKFTEAESLHREASELRRKTLAAGHPDIALGLHNLAMVLRDQGKFAEAEHLSHEALALRRKAWPAAHPHIAQSLNGLVLLLRDQARFAEAEPLARETLDIARKSLPPGHPHTALYLNNLALIWQAQGRLADAEPLYREALDLWRMSLPPGHPDIALALHNLASLLTERRRFAEAERLCREALEIRRRTLPADHADIAQSLNAFALLLRDQGRFAEAEPIARETLAICRRALPASHPKIGTSLNNVGWVLQGQGRLAEAEPLYREALEVRREALPAGHPDIVQSLNNLALALRQQNKLPEAEVLFRELLTEVESAYGKESWQAGNTRLGLGRILAGLNRYAEAEGVLLEAERALSAATGVPAGRHERCVEALAELYTAWDKSEPGQGHAAKAELWKAKLPARQPDKAP